MVSDRLPVFLAFASLAVPLLAQDGGQLYTLHCAACHAPDGKGATGGTFPPLADSPWLVGDGKRTVSIILKGLHGPVEVNGKGYNLEMPPQGDALSDEVIAAILTYVRSSWGNKEGKIEPELVKTLRADLATRDKPWTAPEILKLYPLPAKETALKNLTSRVYKGQWVQIPDFSKIQAENVEEEHEGIIDLKVSSFDDDYGIVWEGDFMALTEGEYEFTLDADDGARLILNGQTVAEVAGLGPMTGDRAKKGKIKLAAGKNAFRLEYFEAKSNIGISLAWKNKDTKQWQWLTDEKAAKPVSGATSIMLEPKNGKTVMYRNFIEGITPRAICFGFPNGTNIAYSADNLAPEIFWTGEFMDAGRHWTDRGQGNQAPAGENITKLTNSRFLPTEALFKGYSLDKEGNPSFKVAIGAQLLDDSWKPGTGQTLVRTLSMSGGTGNLEIQLGNAAITGSEKITLTPGTPVSITYQVK